ncbi:MAG TPA: YkgJ family cysteine cluster protein, partial [Verrucomicrobiae bacterium]|nr:YkgJ family cysteine cluster protein [Verrucomicrobiae bacterium]
AEALVAADALDDSLVAPLEVHVHLLREAAATAGDLRSFLRLRRQLGPCPFLDRDGACAMYLARPLTCRALLATRESSWCSADFSQLTAEQKERFIAGLDREVVAFPMHYLAEPQEAARSREEELARSGRRRFGFSLYGSFPFMVWLERKERLSALFAEGDGRVAGHLVQRGLMDGLLLSMQ